MSIQQLFFNGGVAEPTPLITATGGTITTSGNYKTHTFNYIVGQGTQYFNISYKASGQTYNLLLVGSGVLGDGGSGVSDQDSNGGNGGAGGAGGKVKDYFSLAFDSVGNQATVIPSGSSGSNSTFGWGGAYNYSSADSGYVQVSGGAGGNGDSGGGAGAGSAGSAGTYSAVTGGDYGASGGGGGGGGASGNPGAAGGSGAQYSGDGGAGGSTGSPGGQNGSNADGSTPGLGGGGGGGAYASGTDAESGGDGGDPGGLNRGSGQLVIRYQFQT